MALTEFALIEKFFADCGARRADVALGVGDDAAVLEMPPGQRLVAAIDTLVEGRHFLPGAPPAAIGHRALAVNLSDLAAMGARPAWALLALTLPQADERWLAGFAAGFAALARRYDVALVGGDTTAGPLTVSVQVLGHLGTDALLRSGGSPGDALFVSGTPGDAAAGLALDQARLQLASPTDAAYLRERFHRPEPRVALGERLRGLASACIDVSDGLLGDVGKLAAASGCGARLDLDAIPVSGALERAFGARQARHLALTGGDDYELCFAVPQARLAELQRRLPPGDWTYHRIGTLAAGAGVAVEQGGAVLPVVDGGYDHFA